MNRISALVIGIFLLPGISQAYTEYAIGQSPTDIIHRGNSYGPNDPYLTTNNNNPYSVFRNPYNPNSVFNNQTIYGGHIRDAQNSFQGTLSTDITEPTAANNPYTPYGNPYNQQRTSYPYNPENIHNPYSQFRNPYNPYSVFNSPRYAIPFAIKHGH